MAARLHAQRYGDAGPAMVGLVPKKRPVITVQRYDPVNRALIESMDRQRVIEAIAGQLYEFEPGNTLREMYARQLPNHRAWNSRRRPR